MDDLHVLSAPGTAYVGVERVRIARLDSLRRELDLTGKRLYLKADVQGHELAVIDGAREALPDVQAIECELSFSELYRGQPLFADVVSRLRGEGFVLLSLEEVHWDARSGELLQVNGLFGRTGST
jgi:hypothetical protein